MAFFNSKKNKTPLGIYVHIPFCASKCEYCDFYSLRDQPESVMDSYLDVVCRHIQETGALAPEYVVDTVYFGGGTPTHFGAEGLAEILTQIRRSFDVSDSAEITFEANPESVTDALLKRLRAEGFNRVSLGIQCDDDEILAKIGRPHTYEQAVNAYDRIRHFGFQNVSVDLIYGLPGQSLEAWQQTLENVLTLHPEHISCYGLKVEEGTPLYGYQAYADLADDDTQADMYLSGVEILKEHGYRQYEISNFARRGKVSRHNLKYWMGMEYIGFGPDASSDFAGKRYSYVRSLPEYIAGIRNGGQIIRELNQIPTRERAGEYVMMRLRTIGGINRQEYESAFLLPFDPLEKLLQMNEQHGLARFENGRWHLTPRGFLVSNSIISDLLIAQEESKPLDKRKK